ncbi:MAG TPA: CDP-alcohol phosphatidyltransferase family protein [Rhizomicrobium sp.]|nr:CDP-alcohol phosphatidyltransferase family protein [Rhizomicrobium sp.]
MIRHLPNLLSALRLLAAPFAAWLIVQEHDIAAVLTFAAAGASDGLDGAIARRWGVTSAFGAWLDPVADKLLMLFCFAALYVIGATPFWLLVLVVTRDLAIVAGWLLIRLLSLPAPTSPLLIGKLSTLVQILYVFTLLLLLSFDVNAPRLALAAAWACGLFVSLSAAAYAGIFLRGLFSGKRTA